MECVFLLKWSFVLVVFMIFDGTKPSLPVVCKYLKMKSTSPLNRVAFVYRASIVC